MSVPGAVLDPARVAAERIAYPSGEAAIDAYLATPAGAGNGAGIVVVHEAFGRVEHVEDVCRRLANQGYAALAPDLYTREGGPDPDDLDDVMAKMFALPDAQAAADLAAAAAELRRRLGEDAKVGVLGFCSGGRQALLAGCATDAFDAVVDCWGGFVLDANGADATTPERPVPVVELVDRLSAPVLVVCGDEDDNATPEMLRTLEAKLREAGKDVTAKVYPGAGHAFFADYRPLYREGPAHELWADLLAFLGAELASAAGP